MMTQEEKSVRADRDCLVLKGHSLPLCICMGGGVPARYSGCGCRCGTLLYHFAPDVERG